MEIGSQQWDSTGFTENFAYDNLNRLSSSNVNGQPVQSFTYDAAGNLTSKTGVGSGLYSYPAQGANSVLPHAVQSIAGIGSFSYDANGNLSSDAKRTLSWSSFDMPTQISQGSITANFVYGPEHQRTRQTRSDGSVVIYAGAQEVETKSGQITVKTYWPYGAGVEIDRPLATATEFNWIHTDRLGSPVALSADDGTLREKLAYDAWGKRRTLDGVAINGTATPDSIVGQIDNRGFTGHEMLDQLELVHMNGRIYDPLTARFMSADPLIQDPMNGQSYNRYSYVLNNPTNLTDPTGFSPFDEAMANRWAQRMGAAIADISGEAKDKAIEMVNQMVNGDGRAAVNQEGNKQNGNGAVLSDGVNKDNSKIGGGTNSGTPAAAGEKLYHSITGQ